MEQPLTHGQINEIVSVAIDQAYYTGEATIYFQDSFDDYYAVETLLKEQCKLVTRHAQQAFKVDRPHSPGYVTLKQVDRVLGVGSVAVIGHT